MQKPAEILLARIDQRLADLGKSRWWLSMELTDQKQHGVIRDIERRGSMPGGERLRRMAEILQTTTDWLLGKAENPAQPLSEVTIREVPARWRGPQGEGLKVLGSGYCDDLAVDDEEGGALKVERIMIDTDHVIRMIERPASLWNAPDAYAIYYHGDSMEPRFYQGELGVVDPRRPPSPGDDVVVQLNDGNGGRDVIHVLVKQLVRATAAYVELRQFNPPHTFRIPRSQVARLHRICRPNELLGG